MKENNNKINKIKNSRKNKKVFLKPSVGLGTFVTKEQVRNMLKSSETRTIPKLFTTGVINGTVSNVIAGPILQVSPPSGVGPFSKVSDSIIVRKVDNRISLASGNPTNLIRVIAIQMKAQATISANDMLFASPFSGLRDVYSFINPYPEKQYHLLYDKTFCLVPGADNGIKFIDFQIIPKIKNFNYIFGGGLQAGQICYFLVSDVAAGTLPVVTWNTMMEFDDDL